jgi:cellulose biosynthesis protein BcsQ
MASAKGGSGKTVLTATFGTFLAGVGKKILLIDTDAATNGLTLFYIKEVMLQAEYALSENREPRGVYDFVTSLNPPEVVKLKSGPHLIPATYAFKNTESMLAEEYKTSLNNTLSSVRDIYDYVFLDAQAGSDIFAQIAMSRGMSDEVVIVSEYDPMSAAGVERLKGLFREELTFVRTWVLLNKMLPDFVQSFSDFLEVAKYLSPIPWDADVVRAYARRRLALDPEYGNEHTLAVLQTVRGLFGEDLSQDLEAWVAKRATIIREPIEEQYKDAELELEAILKEGIALRQKRLQRRGWQLSATAVILVTALSATLATLWKTDSRVFLIVMAGAVVVATAAFVILAVSVDKSAKPEIEGARISRRVEVIEEKLKKLEALRSADLETLIRNTGRKASLRS